jgi:predicted Zn-dependent protease
VTLFSIRRALPLLAAAMLALMAVPSAAQFDAGMKVQEAARDLLKLFRPSISGSYVAGQQAMKDLRTDEAARLFNDAAQANWDDPIMLERAFVALAADGQISKATTAARRMLELDPANQLAELVVAGEALKERRYGAAQRRLQTVGEDTFSGITAGILRAWALVGEGKPDEAETLMNRLGGNGLGDFLVFHRALMAEAGGNMPLALSLAQRAFDAEPYVARIAEVYARMLANSGDFDAGARRAGRIRGAGHEPCRDPQCARGGGCGPAARRLHHQRAGRCRRKCSTGLAWPCRGMAAWIWAWSSCGSASISTPIPMW